MKLTRRKCFRTLQRKPLLLFITILGIYYPIKLLTCSSKTLKVNEKQIKPVPQNDLLDIIVERVYLPKPFRSIAIGTPSVISFVNYIIPNEDFCDKSPEMKFLIYIHTSPGHKLRRENLRRTWANKDLFKDHRTKVLFVMGRVDNSTVMQDVMKEHIRHGDIIQGDFLDTYRNLTLKGVLALKWIANNCQNIHYGIKADDDAFVNIFKLIPILKEHRNNKKVMVCPTWFKMHVMKDPKKCYKWCVNDSELAGREYYPRYCSGITFSMSHDLIMDMYKAAFKTPFFWIDDVYISGLLVEKVEDVEYVNIMTKFRADEFAAWDIVKNISVPLKYYISHVRQPPIFHKMWSNALQRLNRTELLELNAEAYCPTLLKMNAIF